MSCLEEALAHTLQINIDFLTKATTLSPSEVVESALRYTQQEITYTLHKLCEKAKQGRGRA